MCPAATSPRSATIAISGRNRIAELDGVRGVAIGLVLIWHYFANGIVAPVEGTWLAHLKSMLGLTWSGVDLFLVLSGFLIGGILLDAKDSPNFFRTFYARRAFRILPLYFILIVLFIEGWLLNRSGIATPLRIFNAYIPVWTYPLFVQNFAMVWRGSFGAAWLALTWSLAIEEQFYLLLPLVIRRVSVNLVPTLAVSAICFCAALPRCSLALRSRVFRAVHSAAVAGRRSGVRCARSLHLSRSKELAMGPGA
jgi:peptidoglycan/LPS O-acetylase OafA/YrhL